MILRKYAGLPKTIHELKMRKSYENVRTNFLAYEHISKVQQRNKSPNMKMSTKF